MNPWTPGQEQPNKRDPWWDVLILATIVATVVSIAVALIEEALR